MFRDRTIDDEIAQFERAYSREVERIQFVIDRDGLDAAKEFAARNIKIYDEAMHSGKPCMARCREYRKAFIASVFYYEEFLGLIETR